MRRWPSHAGAAEHLAADAAAGRWESRERLSEPLDSAVGVMVLLLLIRVGIAASW